MNGKKLNFRCGVAANVIVGNLVAESYAGQTNIEFNLTSLTANGGKVTFVNNGNIVKVQTQDNINTIYQLTISSADIYQIYIEDILYNEVKIVDIDSLFEYFNFTYFTELLEFYTGTLGGIYQDIYFTNNSKLQKIYPREPNLAPHIVLGGLKPDLYYLYFRKGGLTSNHVSLTDINNAPNITYFNDYQSYWDIGYLGDLKILQTLTKQMGTIAEQDLSLLTALNRLDLRSVGVTLTTLQTATQITELSVQVMVFQGTSSGEFIDISALVNLQKIVIKNATNYIAASSLNPNVTYVDVSINSAYNPNVIGDMWAALDGWGQLNGTFISDVEATPDASYDAVKASLEAKGWSIQLV